MSTGRGPLGTGGTAVVTDLSGNIFDVLRDDIGLFGAADPVTRLADIVDDNSAAELADLLTTSATDGAAFGDAIRVHGDDEGMILRFFAGRVDKGLLVAFLDDRTDTAHLTAEMLRINNEQLNTYRSHLKDVESTGLSIDQLDEFTRLNNDLANLQRELAKANRQLAASNAQKDEFLGMAAHELRSPLGVISTYAQFLDEEVEFDDEHRRMMATIRRTVIAMRQLVDELLDVATIQAGRLSLHLAEVDLAEVLDEVAEHQLPLANRKSVRLALRQGDGLVVARGDRSKLVQVLDNLVANAIKFSNLDGEVTVDAIVTSEPGSSVTVTVSDDGIGIPDEMMSALFTPFSVSRRGTEGEPGNGLGLAIVKRIVEGHGGSVDVQSAVDEGTTVTVRIPR